jgi:hypothetical protein
MYVSLYRRTTVVDSNVKKTNKRKKKLRRRYQGALLGPRCLIYIFVKIWYNCR